MLMMLTSGCTTAPIPTDNRDDVLCHDTAMTRDTLTGLLDRSTDDAVVIAGAHLIAELDAFCSR